MEWNVSKDKLKLVALGGLSFSLLVCKVETYAQKYLKGIITKKRFVD